MYSPSDDLLERLRSLDVTPKDVLEYLWGQHGEIYDPSIGPEPPSPHDFFDVNTDLANYAMARDWWPKTDKLPAQFAFPTIFVLCADYWDEDPRIGATFAERLLIRGNAVSTWMLENGINPLNVNETPEERRARLNKEGVKRLRAKRKGGTPDAEYAEALSSAWAVYLAVCAERRAMVEHYKLKIKEAKGAWEKIKNNPPQ